MPERLFRACVPRVRLLAVVDGSAEGGTDHDAGGDMEVETVNYLS